MITAPADSADRFVQWNDDLRDAFCRAAGKVGCRKLAALLDVSEAAEAGLRNGISGGRVRRFIALRKVLVIADVLDEPELEALPTLSRSEMSSLVSNEQAGRPPSPNHPWRRLR